MSASAAASTPPSGPPKAGDRAAREQAVVRLLSGASAASAVPVEATDPGEEFWFPLYDVLTYDKSKRRRKTPPKVGLGRLGNDELAQADADKAFAQKERLFYLCYEAGLLNNPNLTGSVKVRVIIAPDGTPARVEQARNDMPDSSVVACVLKATQKLRFPARAAESAPVELFFMFSDY
jgi:hypothetical protein